MRKSKVYLIVFLALVLMSVQVHAVPPLEGEPPRLAELSAMNIAIQLSERSGQEREEILNSLSQNELKNLRELIENQSITTASGELLYKVPGGVYDHHKTGLTWRYIELGKDGRPLALDLEQARKYCEDRFARLVMAAEVEVLYDYQRTQSGGVEDFEPWFSNFTPGVYWTLEGNYFNTYGAIYSSGDYSQPKGVLCVSRALFPPLDRRLVEAMGAPLQSLDTQPLNEVLNLLLRRSEATPSSVQRRLYLMRKRIQKLEAEISGVKTEFQSLLFLSSQVFASPAET